MQVDYGDREHAQPEMDERTCAIVAAVVQELLLAFLESVVIED